MGKRCWIIFIAPTGGVAEYLGLDNSVWDTARRAHHGAGARDRKPVFQIHSFTRVGDAARARQAAAAMRHCLERGWDTEYGGLFLGIDVEGKHRLLETRRKEDLVTFTEAMCGTLLAYEQLQQDWCLEWYGRFRIGPWHIS